MRGRGRNSMSEQVFFIEGIIRWRARQVIVRDTHGRNSGRNTDNRKAGVA